MGHKVFFPLAVFLISVTLQSYNDHAENSPNISFSNTLLYDILADTSINSEAYQMALKGLEVLSGSGNVKKPELMTLIDYSLPSTSPRLFVIDLQRKNILHKSLVAHGKNSGELYATRFSNRLQSHQTALGFYITGDCYKGGQGYSMHMFGVDTGFNDNAVKRSIVMHGAEYVSPEYAEKYGRLGRSFGCPAIPAYINKEIIDLIKDGSVVFSYFPDSVYLSHSVILNRN